MAEPADAPARRRPRLAYVVHTLNPGGTERLAVDMALAFSASCDVMVVCLDEPGLWAGTLRERGIPVHCVWRQPGLDLSVPVALARLFRAAQVDLIHAHQCTPWFYAALSRFTYRRPRLLLEEHGRFHPEVLNARRVRLNRWLTRRLTHSVVAVSKDIRERLERYEGIDAARTQVVYNGTRALPPLRSEERAAVRGELGCRDGELLIGTVGRLDPIKNLPLLLRAFAAVRARRPALRLAIVGEGPERATVEKLIAELQLADAVTLTGFRPDARRLMAAFDVFTMASFSEGTSMALLEAMSAALPITVSAVGGNPEILRDGDDGLLFPSDDQPALERALERLADDPALRARLGTAARQDFEARFSFDAMLAQYARLYGQLLDAPVPLQAAASSP